MMKEIANRGPIACGVDANPLREYKTGIATDAGDAIDHVISVVGWGTDEKEGLYWIVRNSWGEYWGEQGYVRVKSGSLAVERQCAWAVPKDFTAPEKDNSIHCFEDGSNCKSKADVELRVPQKAERRKSEVLPRHEQEALGVQWRGNSSKQSSHTLLEAPVAGYPAELNWC